MTKREKFLIATTVLFAASTAGLALQHCVRPPFGPGHSMERAWKDGKRPDFFAKADANNDGFVTKAEMLTKQQTRLDDMFATVDTDKDGKLTKEEMEKGRELMRAKWKARFEAERNSTPQPETQPEAK